jgi:hypothetical protein
MESELMEQKHYLSINRMKPQYTDCFEPDDYIVIQEKIDGANFSIRYDKTTNTIKAFSRRRELDFTNNLRGAWNWSQTLDIEKIKSVLGDTLVLFGEWLVPHSCKYPDDKYNKAYFYDVFDLTSNEYLPQKSVRSIVNKLNLTLVPTFYEGVFTSWKHINSFVGKTELGGDYGEGIVVKNQTKLKEVEDSTFYVKLVSEQFCEHKGHKETRVVDVNKIIRREELQQLTDTIVTRPRIEKILHKMVDETIIPANWNESNMGVIAKTIGKEVYYDCVKEEIETVDKIGEEFGKFASSTAMKITRNILKEKNTV